MNQCKSQSSLLISLLNLSYFQEAQGKRKGCVAGRDATQCHVRFAFSVIVICFLFLSFIFVYLLYFVLSLFFYFGCLVWAQATAESKIAFRHPLLKFQSRVFIPQNEMTKDRRLFDFTWVAPPWFVFFR